MKNFSIISSLFVALFFSFQSNAQVKFGVKAGVNASLQNKIPDEFSGTPYIGMMGGVFVRIPVAEKFQIQPEVMISSQGVNSVFEIKDKELSPGTTLNVTSKDNNRMNYLNIPIMLRYNLTKKFSLELGYQVGVFLWGKSEVNSATKLLVAGIGYLENSEESSTLQYRNKDVNTIDQSIVGGFSYEIDNGLELNLRFQQGLNGFYKQPDKLNELKVKTGGAVDVDITDIRNAMLQVGLSYSFPLKKQ